MPAKWRNECDPSVRWPPDGCRVILCPTPWQFSLGFEVHCVPSQSGRGLPHSTTLPRLLLRLMKSSRSWTAAVLCRFGWGRTIRTNARISSGQEECRHREILRSFGVGRHVSIKSALNLDSSKTFVSPPDVSSALMNGPWYYRGPQRDGPSPRRSGWFPHRSNPGSAGCRR